jgi:hypothetical protein
MTAINPAKLKLQTAELGEFVSQPDQFIIELHELLSFYSARIRRTNLSESSLNLQTYQAPDPVINALESEITERLPEDPDAGFALVDKLWMELWVEFRKLAIQVLGILPVGEPDRVIKRLQEWLETCPSEDIRRMIMTEGMIGLTNKEPDQCLKFIQDLISFQSKESLQAALFGLESLAANPSYLNLPVLFRLLSKILLADENGLVKEISSLLQVLASRSEQETTYFLLSQLSSDHKSDLIRVIRKVIKKLSPENQALIQEKMDRYRK